MLRTPVGDLRYIVDALILLRLFDYSGRILLLRHGNHKTGTEDVEEGGGVQGDKGITSGALEPVELPTRLKDVVGIRME